MVNPLQDEFESTTDNAALVELLRRRIDGGGAITFRDFMETVLYHPNHGYYATREPMGRRGDYLTSPEVNPVFGALVAKQLSQFWELMGRPSSFDVVEQGAGTGLLARDVLRWSSTRAPQFASALRYQIIELSPSLRRRQHETLEPAGEVTWLDALPSPLDGCLLSNELVDSFPVHRVVRRGGDLSEVYVALKNGRFVEQVGALSTDAISQYFDDGGVRPGDGCVAEVNLEAIDWMHRVGSELRRGFVLTFDYGYEAHQLYAPWRRDGTLLCFHRHTHDSDPYRRIGKQDITAHIDFSALRRVGAADGLEVGGYAPQAKFLSALGIGAGVDAAAKESPDALEEYYARRRAVQELIDPAGLGRIRVLAQSKDVPEAELWGFPEDANA